MSFLPTYGAPPPGRDAVQHPARSFGGGHQLRLRPMTPADIGAVMRIEAAAHPIDAWHADAFSEAVGALRTYLCRVAADPDGALIGYAVVSLATDQSDLQNLTVRDDRRRRGIGRQLLDDVLGEAARRGAREAFLEVRHDNAAALALYESYGFAVVGRRRNYYARGIDAIVMRVGLPPAPPRNGGRP